MPTPLRRTGLLAALLCTATSCHDAALHVVLDRDTGVVGAAYSLYAQQGHSLQLVGTGTQSADFPGLPAGTLWLQSQATQGTGTLQASRLDGGDQTIHLAVHQPDGDPLRAARVDVAVGKSTSIQVTDAVSVTTRLLVPAGAFVAPTTITLTPHRHPLLGFANGNGFTLSLSRAPISPLYVEVSGGETEATLALYDAKAGLWTPVSGTTDDAGVRFYPVKESGVYSEVGTIPVVNPDPGGGSIAPGEGIDEYAAYASARGAVQEALAWISGRHPDGGELSDEENALIDQAAAIIQEIADRIADKTCKDGVDVGYLKLAYVALATAQSLGSSSDFEARMTDLLKRCVAQILLRDDCKKAIAAGDVVMVEIQRQLLRQGLAIARTLGNLDIAMQLHDALVDCVPADPCTAAGPLSLGDGLPMSGGAPAVGNQCGGKCTNLCTVIVNEDLCDEEGPPQERDTCVAGCEGINAGCAVAMWVKPGPVNRCTYYCECKWAGGLVPCQAL